MQFIEETFEYLETSNHRQKAKRNENNNFNVRNNKHSNYRRFTAFGQEPQKIPPPEKGLVKVNERRDTSLDSLANFQKFRKEAEIKIIENENRIMVLKEKNWNENLGVEQRYNKMVIVLQQKNIILKKKISEYDETINWLSFERDFNNDMDELESGIKNIVINFAD